MTVHHFESQVTDPGWTLPSSLGESWMVQGNCAATGEYDAPFPTSASGVGSIGYARKLCDGCVVQSRCLEHALVTDERHGVWGGYTPAEREQLRRRARRAS